MIEIEARGGVPIGSSVRTWSFMDACRADLRVGICNLLKQLSRSQSAPLMNPDEFGKVCQQNNVITALAFDLSDLKITRVVGMAMMFVHRKFSSVNGYIEDVVVDEQYRGRKVSDPSIAVRLMNKLFEVAKELGLKNIHLSSGNQPDRAAAHKLYLKLGFEKRDSTLFRKKL